MMAQGGIRRQLRWLGVIPALIMLVLVLVTLTWQRLQDADNEVRELGGFLARQLAAAAEYGVLSGNTSELRRHANMALQRPDVYYVAFRDETGQVLLSEGRATSDGRGGLLEFRAGIYRQPLSASETERYVDPGDRVGEVVLGLAPELLAARQKEILAASLVPALLAMMVGLVCAGYLARRIAEPLSYLSGLVRVIRGGDYRARGDHHLQGELSDLQRDINELASGLERARADQQRAMGELRQAHRSAQQASQAKTDFLAMMSHELRTPMNGVLGMLQLLETTKQNEEQREYTQAALESTGHLLEVINDILDFSRIEAGRMDIDQTFFAPGPLLENCIGTFRYVARHKGLYLELEGLEQLEGYDLYSDPTRLRQILSNLISNAVKFTEQGGVRVTIQAAADEHGLMNLSLSVTDTGIGISDAQRDRLFVAFSQLDASPSRRYGGTGLGLAIARRLAEMLGGDLAVKSQPGEGSCFTLRLRVRARVAGELASDGPRIDDGLLSGRALLVEDNLVNRMVAARMLENLGLEVVSCGDGETALNTIQGENFDVVLMDVQMPVMDGLEATRAIRRWERAAGRSPVPIIALTANALGGERERCLASGMDDHLAKPYRRQLLAKLLSRYLKTADAG